MASNGPPTIRQMLLLAASLLAACCVVGVDGHAFMFNPRSRMLANGRPAWEAAEGNGLGPDARGIRNKFNDQADVCGDPHQSVGDKNMRNMVTSPQATYTAGQTITVTFRVNANHGGWFGVRLCPSTRVNPSQSCFDAHTLVNADTPYTRWWITTGTYAPDKPPVDYPTRWRLPAGVTCDGGCVLQMHYRTANSCVDSCSVAECGPIYAARGNPVTDQRSLSACSSSARTEIFKDCSDIRIAATGGSTNTPTCTGTYTVKSGDNCWAIAHARGLNLANLIAINPTVNPGCTNLKIGQVLCLGLTSG